jgi:hypothetical protein
MERRKLIIFPPKKIGRVAVLTLIGFAQHEIGKSAKVPYRAPSWRDTCKESELW